MLNWFIITSNACNLCCSYCLNEPHPLLPVQPSWNLETLKNFIEKDDNPTLAFYGGEPLLNISLIKDVMDEIEAENYTLQTNGLLLNKIPTKYLLKFTTILVSLDGVREITDSYRGKGTYEKVSRNIQEIRNNGYNADLIARMTITEKSDIYRDVIHLLNNEKLGFDNVHWQLDCQWDDLDHTRWNNFKEWIENYNNGISNLVTYWTNEMEKGIVKGIVPFLGVFNHILNDTITDLPCEAGLRSFAVRTDGVITVCPLPPEYEFSVVGDIETSIPQKLENSVKVENPCPSCEIYHLCGGRCLFANKTKLWGEEGFNLVCNSIKHLVNQLKLIKPKVEKLIYNKTIHKNSFNYPKFNNTTEIIP